MHKVIFVTISNVILLINANPIQPQKRINDDLNTEQNYDINNRNSVNNNQDDGAYRHYINKVNNKDSNVNLDGRNDNKDQSNNKNKIKLNKGNSKVHTNNNNNYNNKEPDFDNDENDSKFSKNMKNKVGVNKINNEHKEDSNYDKMVDYYENNKDYEQKYSKGYTVNDMLNQISNIIKDNNKKIKNIKGMPIQNENEQNADDLAIPIIDTQQHIANLNEEPKEKSPYVNHRRLEIPHYNNRRQYFQNNKQNLIKTNERAQRGQNRIANQQIFKVFNIQEKEPMKFKENNKIIEQVADVEKKINELENGNNLNEIINNLDEEMKNKNEFHSKIHLHIKKEIFQKHSKKNVNIAKGNILHDKQHHSINIKHHKAVPHHGPSAHRHRNANLDISDQSVSISGIKS